MAEPALVIAGSYHEFFAFLKKKGYPRDTKDYTFFSDPTHLRNLWDVKILCLGKYRKSPVYDYPYVDKKLRNIRFVDETGSEV